MGLLAVDGVPESRLTDEAVRGLPDRSAAAPWPLLLSAIVWVHRATEEAVALLPARLRAHPRVPVTIGAFIRYRSTPVGPYSEVLASPVVVLPRGVPACFIPFIAVDSLASVHGGRTNWALPKALAGFEWHGATRARGHGVSPAGRWSVSARAEGVRAALPVPVVAANRQPAPGGATLATAITGLALAAPARVEVTTAGPSLPTWLLAGSHAGAVVPRARLRFGVPRRLGVRA